MTCDPCFVPVLPSVRAHNFNVLICSNILLIGAETIVNLLAATLFYLQQLFNLQLVPCWLPYGMRDIAWIYNKQYFKEALNLLHFTFQQ